jgi:L-iditol 2-dehydrogenase
MKTVRFYDKQDIRIEDVEMPKLQKGGIIAKVVACAICGTDVKLYCNGNPRMKPPQIIGHEFVAEITELDNSIEDFSIGDYVTMATSISCGKCDYCRTGHTNRCEELKCISYDYPGAFAEFISVPSLAIENGNLVKTPKKVGEMAALAEPISCAINSQIISGIKSGDCVVIVGCGPLGAIHTQVAKAFGATKIIVTELSRNRLQMAEKLGVDEIIDVSRSNPVEKIMRMTNNRGADIAIVTAPVAKVQEESLRVVKKGGMVNLFASLPRGSSMLNLDSRIIHYRELSITGASDSSPEHVKLAVKFLSEGLISEDIVTHRLNLQNFFDGIQLMKKEESLKILLIP